MGEHVTGGLSRTGQGGFQHLGDGGEACGEQMADGYKPMRRSSAHSTHPSSAGRASGAVPRTLAFAQPGRHGVGAGLGIRSRQAMGPASGDGPLTGELSFHCTTPEMDGARGQRRPGRCAEAAALAHDPRRGGVARIPTLWEEPARGKLGDPAVARQRDSWACGHMGAGPGSSRRPPAGDDSNCERRLCPRAVGEGAVTGRVALRVEEGPICGCPPACEPTLVSSVPACALARSFGAAGRRRSTRSSWDHHLALAAIARQIVPPLAPAKIIY